MGQQAVGAIVPGRAATGVYLGAGPLGFGQPAGEPFILAAIDDGAVIRAGQPLGIEAGEVIAIGLDKGLLLTARQQHIVGGDADLAGVEALAEDHPLHRQRQRHVGGDEAGALATEFQGERGELGGRRGHYQPAHGGGAGKQQVIEGQGAEGGRHLGVTFNHHHLALVEDAVQQLAQHPVGVGGEFGELQHGAVAGGDGADEGAEAQHHREVPGHYDADHPERLIEHLHPGRRQQQAGVAAVRAHPALDPFLGVVDLHDAGEDVGNHAVVVAALAIVFGQGIAQRLLVGDQGAFELAEVGSALAQARHGMLLTGVSESGQSGRERQLVGGLLQLHRFHGIPRWLGTD